MADRRQEQAEKFKEFEAQGWEYLHDGLGRGVWWHETLGCVNKGGGKFYLIKDAVDALERFLENWEKHFAS